MSREEMAAEWNDLADRLETSARQSEQFAADMRRRAERARREAVEALGVNQ